MVAAAIRGSRVRRIVRRDWRKAARPAKRSTSSWISSFSLTSGLSGSPNAGKSSLLASGSGANPRVASYAFTTTEPNLGVVDIGWSSFVLADIPGLIEGAHEGKGLGDQFLRHVERTAVLIHIIDGSLPDVLDAWRSINNELALHEARLEEKPQIVAINKIDMPEVQEQLPEFRESFAAEGVEEVFAVSAVTGEGVTELMRAAYTRAEAEREARKHAPTPEIDEPEVILRPEPDRIMPVVEVEEEGVWRLKHPRIERLADGNQPHGHGRRCPVLARAWPHRRKSMPWSERARSRATGSWLAIPR